MQSPDYKRLYTNTTKKAVDRALFRGLYQGIGSVILATIPSCGQTTLPSRKLAHLLKQEHSLLPMKGPNRS